APHGLVPIYTVEGPEVHNLIAEMRRVADEVPDRLLIGEIYLPVERLVAYYGRDLSGVHLPFNFSLLSVSWCAPAIGRLVGEYEAVLPVGGWPNWVLGNHDRPRIASRVGPHQARIAAMLLLTLRGTPTIYYGDEIAMKDVAIAPAQVRDPLEKNIPGRGLGRDGCRTPMRWDSTTHAGFSSVEPWLPLSTTRASTPDTHRALITAQFLNVCAKRARHPASRHHHERPMAAPQVRRAALYARPPIFTIR